MIHQAPRFTTSARAWQRIKFIVLGHVFSLEVLRTVSGRRGIARDSAIPEADDLPRSVHLKCQVFKNLYLYR